MMARVRGSFRVMVVPWPRVLATSIVPRRASRLRFTTSMPTPAARDVGHCLGGGESGLEDEGEQFGLASPCIGGQQPFFLGLGADGGGVEAPPVVRDRHQHLCPGMDGLQQHPPSFRFALPPAFFRRF